MIQKMVKKLGIHYTFNLLTNTSISESHFYSISLTHSTANKQHIIPIHEVFAYLTRPTSNLHLLSISTPKWPILKQKLRAILLYKIPHE